MAFEEIRKALADELGKPRLRDGLWKDLVHTRYVEQVAGGRWGIEQLAALYRRKEEDIFPESRRRRETVTELEPDARAKALDEIVALRASGFLDVDSFRRSVLDGQLLAAAEIPSWIEQQAEREGAPALQYITIPICGWDIGWLLEEDKAAYADWLEQLASRVRSDPACEMPPMFTSGPAQLSYSAPGSRPKSVLIRGDGTLGDLKSAVSGLMGLCHYTGWPEHHAVAFLLSGWRPPTPKVTVAIHYGLSQASARIELSANPRLAPKDVATAYNQARRRFVAGRDRPMLPKHLALAIFTEEARSSSRSWSELRGEWNSLHPKWRFPVREDPQARRFALEARTAWTRVTGDRWRGLGGQRHGRRTTNEE